MHVQVLQLWRHLVEQNGNCVLKGGIVSFRGTTTQSLGFHSHVQRDNNAAHTSARVSDTFYSFKSASSLYSCVKWRWRMATFQLFLTAAATTAPHSPPLNCSSSVTLQICARPCATFATASLQGDCTQWAKAPGQAFSCPTWGSAALRATWRQPSVCPLCSAARVGLRAVCAGLYSGCWCCTRRSVSAGNKGWGIRGTPGFMMTKIIITNLCYYNHFHSFSNKIIHEHSNIKAAEIRQIMKESNMS